MTTTTEICTSNAKVWVVTMYSEFHQCPRLLGTGKTRQAALENAYGPMADWSSEIKESMKKAEVYSITEAEFYNYPCPIEG